MDNIFKKIISQNIDESYTKETKKDGAKQLEKSLASKLIEIRRQSSNTSDLIIKEMQVGSSKIALVMFEGMFNTKMVAQLMTLPMTAQHTTNSFELLDWLRKGVFVSGNQIEIYTYDELFYLAISGFVVVLIDGIEVAVSLGVQGFNFRSVGEPDSEANVKGGKEGFVEPLRINMSMLRRKMKSPSLKLELMTIGTVCKTDICLAYRTDKVNPAVVDRVRRQLSTITLDNIMAAGYITPYLDVEKLSIFTGVGNTQRPDTLAAKIAEGRVGVMIDGTPFALIVPFLFVENFQSLDDYASRPFYGTFIRWVKYLSFFAAVLLPGMYVAIVSFNIELFPEPLLYNIVKAQRGIPFPVMVEALIIYLVYEMLKEAGLRMPKGVGHTVSIVGGLVVGDAAVRAGLVSTPMIIIVALTAITSYTAPSLYETVTFLRFIFIVVGGSLGLVGVMLLFTLVCANLCSLCIDGTPITSPVSPFSMYAMRDVIFRMGWKNMSREQLNVSDLPGSKRQV